MTGALEGIRVLELADFQAGPIQATILGDYGAEVIKIERAGIGSFMRDPSALYKSLPDHDFHYTWENFSRNKKSFVVNLKSSEGQKIAHRLVQSADVFLTNVEMSELKKFNLTYETLSQINPRLIYAHSSGYGHEGPDAGKRGFDLGSWARSGAMLKISEPGSPPPLNPIGLPDCNQATYSALGIILALFVRERTGKGQMVTNSLFGSMLWACMIQADAAAITGKADSPRTQQQEANPFYNRYLTKDGRWLILLRSDWHDSCEALEITEYENDPRFDNFTKRMDDSPALIEIISQAVAKKTMKEWEKRFEGKDIIWSIAQTYLEAVEDPQTIANQYIVDFDHPKYGPIKYTAIPFKLNTTPPSIRTPAPGVGEHTEQVMVSLGYTPEQISKFKEDKVIS